MHKCLNRLPIIYNHKVKLLGRKRLRVASASVVIVNCVLVMPYKVGHQFVAYLVCANLSFKRFYALF